MFIKEIILHGFKSFYRKTSIKLDGNVIAIVGPNGSGKSNIVDAIKWVFGELGAKSIRAEKLADVIFVGTEKYPPMKEAYVTLIFDNSKGIIPLKSEEVSLTRKINQSGESTYFINNKKVKRKDVINLFLHTGVLTNFYSILDNSIIELVLSSKVSESRLVFEEAADISKFKVKKEETLNNLYKTNESLERINDKLLIYKQQYETLEKQARKVDEYTQKVIEIKKEDLESVRKVYNFIIEEINKLKKEIGFLKEDKIKNINKEIDKLEDSLREIYKSRYKIEEKIKLLTKERDKKKNRYFELSNKVISIEKELNKLEFEIKQEEDNLEYISSKKIPNLEREKSFLFLNIKKLESTIQKIEDIIKDKKNNLNELENKYKVLIEKRNKILEEKKQLRKEAKSIEDYINRILNQKEKILIDLKVKRQSIENLKNEIKNISEEISKDKIKISDIDSKIKELNRVVEELKQEENTLIEQKNTLSNELNKINEKISALNAQKKILEENLNSNNRHKFISKMTEKFPDINTIVDKIKIKDEKYLGILNLLEIFFIGNNEIINKIKEIETNLDYRIILRDSSFNSPYNSYNKYENLIPLLSIIEIEDPDIKNILENVFYNFYIAQDDNTIIDFLKNQNKNQDLIFIYSLKTGNIFFSNNIFQPSKDQESYYKIKDKILYIEKEIEDSIKTKEDIKEKIQNIEIKILKLNLKQKINEIENLKKEKIILENQIKEKEKILQSNNYKLNNLEEGLEKYNQMSFNDKEIEEKKLNLESIKKEISELENSQDNLHIEIEELTQKISILKDEINSKTIEKNSALNQLNNIKEKIKHIEEEIKNSENKIEKKIERIQKLKERLEQLKNTDISKKDLEILEQEITQYDNEISLKEKELFDLISKISNIEKELNNKKSEKEKISEELLKKETLIRSLDEKLKYISDRLISEYGETLNSIISNIDTFDKIDITTYEKIQERINIQKSKLSKMRESLNMLAKKEFDELRKEYDILLKNKSDIEKAKRDLEETIKKLDKQATEKFLKIFQQARENFQYLFSLIFPYGKGDLILINEQDPLNSPIEIIAKPKGIRSKRLSMLSMGEKTLTAISLIFALHKIKPSPFVILDEVDAPLDESNVVKFIKLIKEFSKNTQYIIITHNKRTVEFADAIYGVTMQEIGVSTIVSKKLSEVSQLLEK